MYRIRDMLHGEAADAAAVRDAFSVAKRGGRVCGWWVVAGRGSAAVAGGAGGDGRGFRFSRCLSRGDALSRCSLPKDLGKLRNA